MNRNFIAGIGIIVAFAGTVAAQDVTVVGTGDPRVDVPAVQAAVDQGGRVILNGHFSFDAPPQLSSRPAFFIAGQRWVWSLFRRPSRFQALWTIKAR